MGSSSRQLLVTYCVAILSGCSGSQGADTPAPTCIPSCAGKQCGPDGCGNSCGSCDDGNRCTTDTCTAQGTCTSSPGSDYIVCPNLVEEVCTNGVPSTVDCRVYCRDHGYNVANSCPFGGTCSCGTTTLACTSSQRGCDTEPGYLDTCDPAAGIWTSESCTRYCTSIGYEGSEGCRPAPFNLCACFGSTPTGTCHGYGADCSDHGLCCSGLTCTWQYLNGTGMSTCLTSSTCEARCRQGSICCGGGFCSGECIGNPCCN
jgi:hypothetical protein